MKIQDKLNIWVKLTNIDPTKEQKNYTINMSGRLSDFDIKRMNDKIKEALKYDATGVFADAYLSEYFEKFIADKSFSVKEMLANPETESFLADARLLQNALAESDSANMIKSDAEKAMNFYGMSAEELSLFIKYDLISYKIKMDFYQQIHKKKTHDTNHTSHIT